MYINFYFFLWNKNSSHFVRSFLMFTLLNHLHETNGQSYWIYYFNHSPFFNFNAIFFSIYYIFQLFYWYFFKTIVEIYLFLKKRTVITVYIMKCLIINKIMLKTQKKIVYIPNKSSAEAATTQLSFE